MGWHASTAIRHSSSANEHVQHEYSVARFLQTYALPEKTENDRSELVNAICVTIHKLTSMCVLAK